MCFWLSKFEYILKAMEADQGRSSSDFLTVRMGRWTCPPYKIYTGGLGPLLCSVHKCRYDDMSAAGGGGLGVAHRGEEGRETWGGAAAWGVV